MAFYQWRRFNFFDFSKGVDKGHLLEVLEDSSTKLTCLSSGRGFIFAGDDLGRVHCLNRRLELDSFKAFDAYVHVVGQIRHTSLLAVVGKDQEGSAISLKIYDLDKLATESAENGEQASFNPQLIRTSRLNTVSSATSISVDEHLNLIAVGCEDGSVTLLGGDVTRDRGTKRKVLLSGNDGTSCSGLAFKIVAKNTWLYVATSSQVMCFDVTVKDKETCSTLDSIGCDKDMAIQVDGLADVHFIMGRKDAVYFYTQDGRGQCYPIEGTKTGIHWFRNYLVVSTEDGKRDDDNARNTLTVFDVANKFIAYTAPVKPVRSFTSEWGTLFVVTKENKLYQLTEKDIQSKLDLLFKKNFYDVAIKIAQSNQYDNYGLVDIFRQYGDHLYSKGDYTGAVENYVKTAGYLEPSYVIGKFLDSHRIHDLTTYLMALHKNGLANADHTILLLNCYTKLKDEKHLDEFIFKKDDNAIEFDVNIAIANLRQSNYSRQALSLAERHQLHDMYLRIQLDDLKDYGRALEYIANLEFSSAEEHMKEHGGVLMLNIPQETVAFLKLLCTEYRRLNDPLVSEEMLSGDQDIKPASNPDYFLKHFNKHPAEAVNFLEYIVRKNPKPSSKVWNALLENYFILYRKCPDDRSKLGTKITAVMENPEAAYDIDHCLVNCQMNGFRDGTLYIYEKRELYGEILKYHIEQEDWEMAVETCRKFGDQNPALWLNTLNKIANNVNAKPQQMSEILTAVEQQRLMPPLMVVDTLSKSSGLQFSLVREFLRSSINSDDAQAKIAQNGIDKYAAETAKVHDRIKELKGESVTFQATKCSLCPNRLDHPMVSFTCQHTFHLQCFQSFPESESECPQCSKPNKHIIDIIKSQHQSRDHHDSFHSQLEKADDGFSVVADYFSRGMFRRHITSIPTVHQSVVAPRPASSISPNDIREDQVMTAPAKVSPVAGEVKKQVTVAKNLPSLPSSSMNPFGNFDDSSPSRENSPGNPFGDGDEDYDDDLNPFS